MKTERYTTEQVIAALRQAKGMVTIAAQALKCEPRTVRNYIDRYPTVKQACDDERAQVLDIAELRLYQAIQDREPWAITFTLKTIGKDRGYVDRQEVTGANGAPLLKGYVGVSPDDFDDTPTTE